MGPNAARTRSATFCLQAAGQLRQIQAGTVKGARGVDEIDLRLVPHFDRTYLTKAGISLQLCALAAPYLAASLSQCRNLSPPRPYCNYSSSACLWMSLCLPPARRSIQHKWVRFVHHSACVAVRENTDKSVSEAVPVYLCACAFRSSSLSLCLSLSVPEDACRQVRHTGTKRQVIASIESNYSRHLKRT